MDAREGSDTVGVGQSLFVRQGPDGRTWEFAATDDGGCAVLCDGSVVAHGDSREETVAELLGQFLHFSDEPATAPPFTALVEMPVHADGLGHDYHAA